jgi:hypothetical protein
MAAVFDEVIVVPWADHWGVGCTLAGRYHMSFKVGTRAEAELFAKGLAETRCPPSLAHLFPQKAVGEA